MKKFFVLFMFLLFSMTSMAGSYVENMQITRIHTKDNGFTYIWVSSPPSDTCSWYAEDFRFDSTTPAGKSMLSNLLAAKAQGEPLTFWYIASNAPGTTQLDGCTETGLAQITGVGQ